MTRLVSIFLASLMALPAYGLEVHLKLIPEGKRLIIDGQQMQCYTFEEWKELVKVDDAAWTFSLKLLEMSQIIVGQKQQIASYEEIIKVQENQLSLSKKEIEKLNKDYLDLSKELEKAERGSIWPPIVLAGGALLATIGITAFVLSRS